MLITTRITSSRLYLTALQLIGSNCLYEIQSSLSVSQNYLLVKLRITISKYHSWYLCQISLQIMLLPILTL